MIAPLIAWGIGFGGVNYLPRHGLSAGVAPPPTVNLGSLIHSRRQTLMTGGGGAKLRSLVPMQKQSKT